MLENKIPFHQKAEMLLEILPNITQFVGETFVIKYTMLNEILLKTFAHNIVLLKQLGINPVIIHDGEHEINSVLRMLGINSKIVNNIRFADKETIKIIEMTLCGALNRKIVECINSIGGSAIGLCGKDGNLMKTEKITTTLRKDQFSNIESILDVGFIGKPIEINPDILFFLEESDFIPVIAPIGYGHSRETYYANPDSVASMIAVTVSASKLVIFSETDEEINTVENKKISTKDLKTFLNSKHNIEKRIIDRFELCARMVEECSGMSHIVDGRIPNILLDLLTENNLSLSITGDL